MQIVEVGPRDGLQNDRVSLSVEQKVDFARRVARAGIRRIEICSFVNPARVPQMAGAEEVAAGVAGLTDVEGSAGEGCAVEGADVGGRVDGGAGRGRIDAIGLVLNVKGWRRAAATTLAEVNVVVAASDAFAQHNSGTDVEGTVSVAEEVTALARAAGRRVSATISTSFGCPYEGEVALERVVGLARRVADAGVDEVALADTIGAAVPVEVRRRFEAVRQALGPGVALRAHFHNTRNAGYANALAALDAGVTALDSSLGGIGGCPFAPKATGNIATEDLVFLLERSGIDTGVDLDRLLAASAWLEEQLGRPVPALLPKAGVFPAA